MRTLLAGLIGAGLVANALFVAGVFGFWDRFVPQQAPIAGTLLPQAPALFETSLQSRITSTDTSMTLVANSLRGGGSLSGYNCFTIDEGRTDQEFVCGTVAGTSVTSLERGLDPLTATTTNSSIQYAHRVGANVKVTDFPVITRLRHQANGTDTFPNLLTYANTVLIGSLSPTTTIATKYYVDNVAVAGASNANTVTKGIVELATQTEAASSTVTGGTGAVLAYGNGIATDTPNSATRASRILMSDMTGFLKQAWLDLTALWTFTGGLASTGTTTISAANINTNPLKLNGLAYAFSSSRGASSTVPMEDGGGNISWNPIDWQLCTATTTTAVMNTATTTIPGTPQDLKIIFNVPSAISGASKYYMTLNGDAASNYGFSATTFGGSQSSYILSSQGGVDLSDNGNSTTSPAFIEMTIKNVSTLPKIVQWKTSLYSAGTAAPAIVNGAAQWNNTSATISSVQIKVTGAFTMPVGTTIRVYCSGR